MVPLDQICYVDDIRTFPTQSRRPSRWDGQTEAGGASFSQCAELTVQSQYRTKQTRRNLKIKPPQPAEARRKHNGPTGVRFN